MINQSNPNHSAWIVALKNVRKHPNADRLQLAEAMGSGIIVGLDAQEGDIGVYFQSGLCLDQKFAEANDLIRRKNPVTGAQEGGMLETNCRIRTQKLRGENSDGLFLRLTSLLTVGVSPDIIEALTVGDYFDTIDQKKICYKYVPKTSGFTGGASSKLPKVSGSIMFHEHYDTAQFMHNVHKIGPQDLINVTEKVHGTSQRVARVQVVKEFKGLKKLVAKLFGLPTSEIYWRYMVGTRRTVVQHADGYYSNDFRNRAAKPFLDKLEKGETIYYEVVGYADDKPIMGTVDNEKLGPVFTRTYGKKTVFKYGCEPGNFDIFVYRITMTNEDGTSIDYH